MTTSEYNLWWQLHVRVARGETLSAQEQADYQTGLDRLDLQETQSEPESLSALRAARAQIDQQTAVHAQMLAHSTQLERQIAALEKTYQQLTGRNLAMDTHASTGD
ncbi:MAG: hypothetical protein OEU26_28175 [Candidatus Tectomicrobia bacterium]|nr:hypothetical protein [Candidatus Tectomicrobia bacterium]